ncbi:MAG: GntR family transcriptional regulator [Actinomycetota bacterium]|nr:GntR family transcriptional regulator [Actinomycetota bacterium]
MLESLAARLDSGAALPSERQLADSFGVARMTVRNEIKRLAADGVLVIRRGSGAYVPQTPPPPLAVGYSFSREMRRRGLDPGSIVLEHNVLLVTSRLAKLLEAPVDSDALRIVRIRTADESAMSIERTTVSLERFPGLQEVDFSQASLYDTLRDNYGIEPGSVTARATAVNPTEEESELLGIGSSDPCLVLNTLQRDRDGLVIEAGRSIYRGDKYDIDISYRVAT